MKWAAALLLLAGCNNADVAGRFEAAARGCDIRWFHTGGQDTAMAIPASQFVVVGSTTPCTVVLVGGEYEGRVWAEEFELTEDSPVLRYVGTQSWEQMRRVVVLDRACEGTFYLAVNGDVNRWNREGQR